jgi:hypothetical protein
MYFQRRSNDGFRRVTAAEILAMPLGTVVSVKVYRGAWRPFRIVRWGRKKRLQDLSYKGEYMVIRDYQNHWFGVREGD